MDQIAEQLVKKLPTNQDTLKRTAIVTGAAVISLAAAVLAFTGYPLALVLPVCVIWAAILLFRNTNVEYEYTCINGSLEIDKILGQTKRRQMLEVEVSTFTAYGKAGEVEESDAEMTTFSAMGTSLMEDGAEGETYYAEFDHGDYGKCCLYFTPDERLRSVLEPFLSRELKRQMRRDRS